MFYIVESEDQLNLLSSYGKEGGYFEVISLNDTYHPKLSTTIGIYIRPLNLNKGFIIPVNHPEGLNVPKDKISQVLSSYVILYTPNKKELLYHWDIKGMNVIDVSLLHSMITYDKLDLEVGDRTYSWFYNKYSYFHAVNQLIPLSKLHQYREERFEKIKKVFEYEIPKGFEFYNTTATAVFYLIEQSGLGIYNKPFLELFKPTDPQRSIVDDKVFTSYNLYNPTGRPTNAFNSVNFAAIPKDTTYRKCFKPQGDYFVEFDFDGYHVRLLAEQLEYPLTSESAHKQLAKQYFGKNEITDEEYSQAKQMNFQALYGKVPETHKDVEVFVKIQQYIDEMWSNYQKDGVVYDPISEKPFLPTLKDMHPAKLMNYTMQSLESSRNILILKEVLKYLRDKQTKVVLYTYDAILFDFYKEDGKEVLEGIQTILEEKGKYPVKFKFSKDLVLDKE